MRDVAKMWKALCPGKRTLAFCSTIDQSEMLAKVLRAGDIRAEHVGSQRWKSPSDQTRMPMGAAECQGILARLRSGDVDVVTTAGMLSEGFDEPRIGSIVILYRIQDSIVRYIQQLGRGLRGHQGKSECIVLDYASNCRRFCIFPQEERAEWHIVRQMSAIRESL